MLNLSVEAKNAAVYNHNTKVKISILIRMGCSVSMEMHILTYGLLLCSKTI